MLADWAWGTALRWRAPAGRGHRDPSSGLLQKEGFLQQATALAQDCREQGLPLSAAVFDFPDLLEVHRMYGSRISSQLLDRLGRSLWRAAGRSGLAGRTGPTQFALALPRLTQAQARAQVQRVLGKVPCVELDAGGDELVLVADFLVAQIQGGGFEALFHRLRAGLSRVQERRLRIERYLESAPASLTRPAELH
ncbi:regulator protein, GGDEF domain-like protein [Ramlibacter tataouinensis TTB310]|uniref:Regulator protein, GGDEF domain-like protein n=1 Tax=Ramlibacter tataouinensis (strain ATCC BAA-407 / DSM 14655 / LMG 21543 / TTB310) TaxID=365046 RepID=F5XZN9_RAMTT|nr:regulator protein, GGDEF domain-like protein [Ramlibacter tataouinensis TTB310]